MFVFCTTNQNVGTGIICMNIYIYIYLLFAIFCLFFLYDVKKIKTLNNLKIFNKPNFVGMTIVITLLSLSGIPPLLGFVGKFLLFLFLFFSQKYIYIFFFLFLNFFSMYFYLQNLRFLVGKTQLNFFLVGGYFVFFNKSLLNSIVLFNLINFFGIFWVEDFFYFFYNSVLYYIF